MLNLKAAKLETSKPASNCCPNLIKSALIAISLDLLVIGGLSFFEQKAGKELTMCEEQKTMRFSLPISPDLEIKNLRFLADVAQVLNERNMCETIVEAMYALLDSRAQIVVDRSF